MREQRIAINKKTSRNRFLLRFASIIFLVFSFGCATTSPNISILDESYALNNQVTIDQNYKAAKILLNLLYNKNKKIAYELGRIPELQDGISNDEVSAIKKFVDCYRENELVFNFIFNEMYYVGLPKVRKYCTPLQALLWLFIDKSYEEVEGLLYKFSTEKLLYSAWVLENNMYFHRWRWRTQQAQLLYNSCTDLNLKEKIVKYYESNKGVVDYIIMLAEQSPGKFDHKYASFDIIEKKHTDRWKNHNTVFDRLNAPELIHFFIYYNFFYEPNEYNSPKKTFYYKFGNSKSLAKLGQLLLKKSGYKTFFICIKDQSSPCRKEHSGAGIIDKNGKYILVVDIPKGRRIVGPFDKEALEKHLRNGNCIPPPRRQFRFNLPYNFFLKDV
ncbi:MAG: hypothetical protein PVG51_10360 [Desulfosarcina sp.]|jgi:hypothetical protein